VIHQRKNFGHKETKENAENLLHNPSGPGKILKTRHELEYPWKYQQTVFSLFPKGIPVGLVFCSVISAANLFRAGFAEQQHCNNA
jgi:hypothetical protein